ncbi:MAG: hypothetical protein ACLUEQ_12790 [Cloacibacillus evryensis]
MLEGGGFWGSDNRPSCGGCLDAVINEKDTKKIIQVKGWGAAAETDLRDPFHIRRRRLRRLLEAL